MLARLEADRSLLWVQTRTIERHAQQLAIDDDGGSVVLGTSLTEPDGGFGTIESLTRYDAHGNAVWELETGLAGSALRLGRAGDAVLFGRQDLFTSSTLATSLVKMVP